MLRFACFMGSLTLFSSGASANFYHLIPNESYPKALESILQFAERGGVLSTGSERAFFTTGFVPDPLSLEVVDLERDVIDYLEINVQILKHSFETSDYQVRRLQAGPFPFLSRYLQERWNIRIRERVNFEGKILGGYFRNQGLYIDSEAAFQKLKSLADSDRIFPFHGDIFSEKIGAEIVTSLKARKETISVFDLSNIIQYAQQQARLFPDDPPGPPAHTYFRKLFRLYGDVVQDSAIMITTVYSQTAHRFVYYAFRWKDLKELSDSELDRFQRFTLDAKFVEGKIYSNDELKSALGKDCRGELPRGR